jgi:undecaprenyl-diphosphatase
MPTNRSRLAALLWTSAAALLFAVLLVLVRYQWSPLESIDRGVADTLNRMVSDSSPAVHFWTGVSWLGSAGVLWVLITAAVVTLAVRRLPRLAVYLAVAGVGSLVLDPILKALVGRLRPVVAHPVAHGNGNSFPSGHSLGSIVCYGALLLVFLPAVPRRYRTLVTGAATGLVLLIGVSRLVLGVHYLSDVIGAWALGVAWLGLTAYAFELRRRQQGERVTAPLSEGLQPEPAADLKPAEPEPEATKGSPAIAAAGVGVGWVLILGVVVGLGELVTKFGNGNVLGDRTIPHWFAAHRTDTLTRWSAVASTLGATQAITLVAVATCVVALAVLRRWRPVIFMVVLMAGELALFLATAAVVRRERPDVPQLDPHLPTFAYPSGHIAATICVYAGLAILVFGHTDRAWRWIALIPAIGMPVMVTVSRLYRGEHHPTDVLGSMVFAAAWIPLLYVLIRPNADRREPGRAPAASTAPQPVAAS